MSNVIFVDDLKTFPKELVQYINNNSSYINSIVTQTIERERAAGLSSLEDNVFDRKGNEDLKQLVKHCETILNKHRMAGYHYMRIDSLDIIMQNGLLPLEWGYYSQFLSSILKKYGASSTQVSNALDCVRPVYNGIHGERKGNLCFFTPLSVLDKNPGYAKFGENIGGEIAERSLSTHMPKIFNLLTDNGSPVVIEFTFQYSDIASFEKDGITWSIVKGLISRYVFGEEIPIIFTGTIQSSVPGGHILRVIDQNDIPYRSVFDFLALN